MRHDKASEIIDLLEGFLAGHIERHNPSLRTLLECVISNQHKTHQLQEKTMSAVDDLVAEVSALKDELAALKTSNDALIAAIENWINSHQGSDDPKVVQAVADLKQAVTDAQAVQAADDAETGKLSQG